MSPAAWLVHGARGGALRLFLGLQFLANPCMARAAGLCHAYEASAVTLRPAIIIAQAGAAVKIQIPGGVYMSNSFLEAALSYARRGWHS